MPPGEAGRMGAPAAAPPLAVPQPGHTAAGSPPRTVPVPDPAVPRGAPPVVPTGPEPVVPGGGPPPTHGTQGAAPMGRPTAGEQTGDAAQEAAAAGPRDISELLAQALEAYRRTAAGRDGAAPEAPGRGADAGELIAQALAAVAPRAERAKEKPSEVVASGGKDAGRGVPEAQAPAEGGGVVEPSGRRAKGEGVEDWMWEWREWRQVAPGQPCSAGLAYSMDLHAGTSWARLPDNQRARLDAAEAARGGGADERPLAPFPQRPDTPPAMVAAGEGAEEEQEAEEVEDEEAYGPGESGLALMYEDDAGPDVYAWTWTRPTRRCGPCPLRCRPLPWGAVSSGTARTMRPRVPTGTASWVRGGGRQGCCRAPWSATSSSAQGRSPGRGPRWPRPWTTARSAVFSWGTRQSWVTAPVMSGRPSPRKASPCRCACPWGACWTRQGWRMCSGVKACTWRCGEVWLTLGVATGPCGPSRPRCWDPMRSWWRCTPSVQRSCWARTACC